MNFQHCSENFEKVFGEHLRSLLMCSTVTSNLRLVCSCMA